MSTAHGKTDHLGRAYAGSQLQIQIYVNRRPDELSAAVVKALPSLGAVEPGLRWVSPLESGRFAEYQDRAFLSALGLAGMYDRLREFWPKGGPVWDALAVAELGGGQTGAGVVLVEAKSHPPEVYGPGCQARGRSRSKIEAALRAAKRWARAPEEADWTGPLYQSANRIAHLYFLREIAGVPAWLANVYFVNDPHSPTSANDWETALVKVKAELGLAGISLRYVGAVFLPARDRAELVEDRG